MWVRTWSSCEVIWVWFARGFPPRAFLWLARRMAHFEDGEVGGGGQQRGLSGRNGLDTAGALDAMDVAMKWASTELELLATIDSHEYQINPRWLCNHGSSTTPGSSMRDFPYAPSSESHTSPGYLHFPAITLAHCRNSDGNTVLHDGTSHPSYTIVAGSSRIDHRLEGPGGL